MTSSGESLSTLTLCFAFCPETESTAFHTCRICPRLEAFSASFTSCSISLALTSKCAWASSRARWLASSMSAACLVFRASCRASPKVRLFNAIFRFFRPDASYPLFLTRGRNRLACCTAAQSASYEQSFPTDFLIALSASGLMLGSFSSDESHFTVFCGWLYFVAKRNLNLPQSGL